MSNAYYQGPVSDHFDGDRFYHKDSVAADKSPFDVLRWSLTRKPVPWPKHILSRTGVVPEATVSGLRITLIGHASLLIQANGVNILVDPVWAERASPLSWIGPRRVTPPAVNFEDLPAIHVVLVTHNHYDHMDGRTIRALWRRDQPQIVMPLGNAGFVQRRGMKIPVQTGDWWQTLPLPKGLNATITPAYHWSSRRLGDYRKALWGGFVLETPVADVYCAGDSAYRDGAVFKEVGRRFGPLAAAVVPIGAYAPRYFMKQQHGDPEEAVQMALDSGARHALGIHWKTFHFSDEPFEEPGERMMAALVKATPHNLTGQALEPGDVWNI